MTTDDFELVGDKASPDAMGWKHCRTCKNKFLCKYPERNLRNLCQECYRASLEPAQPRELPSRDELIQRQVFLKIASEQVKGSPDRLVLYAQGLERLWRVWQ